MSDSCQETCLGISSPTAAGAAGAAESPQPPFISPPLPRDLVARYVDLHVHTGPDVYGRSLDDDEAAVSARHARLGGMVLKNHHSETASRAELVVRRHGVEAWGGIVLNRSVGGVNADAVDAMARVDGGRGRVVWLPTVDAGNHHRVLKLPGEGVEVVTGGRPTRELEAVVRVCAERDLALCTGHSSADDALVVAELCHARGVRCGITHALFPIVGFTEAHVARAAELGAIVELCAINTLSALPGQPPELQPWGTVDAPTCARYVTKFGPRHFLVSTDLGQSGNPIPADGLRHFAADLAAQGLSRADLDLMGITGPRRLLGIPTA